MSRMLFVAMFVCLLMAGQVWAKEKREITFSGGLTLSFELPGERWLVSRKTPEFLVQETVEHVSYHMKEEGRDVPEALEGKVRERLGKNELYVYNPDTGAHLDFDLSEIRDGEPPPSEGAVAQSAEFAKTELSQEKDLSEVSATSKTFKVRGARSAYRVDAAYLRDGEPRTFIGIIGYEAGYWFFFYYTDKNQDPLDLTEIETLLSSLSLSRTAD